MKSPLTVRARDGKKYWAPSGLPTSFHLRGSWACQSSITPAKTVATRAQRPPTFHLIFRPASRCTMKSQAHRSGVSTCVHQAIERVVGSLTTRTPSMRVRTTPLNRRRSETAKSA